MICTSHQQFPQHVCSARCGFFLQFHAVISCFPGVLLRYYLSDFKMVPLARVFTGITFVVTLHMRCISVVFPSFQISSPFSLSRLSPYIALSINKHVSFSLSGIMMSSLLMGLVLSVCTLWLLCFRALFLLTVLHDYTSVHLMILSLVPCIC